MEATLVYRLWQAPFAEQKLRPFLHAIERNGVRRVLDVGCGPGTNAHHFADCDYLGVDINPSYIADATRRFGPRFRTVDVTTIDPASLGAGYDCILMNSLLHHLDDGAVDRLLGHVEKLLSPDGRVHILDLVLPETLSVSRALARLDRGDHPRPLDTWRRMFAAHFTPMTFEPYPLGLAGLTLWSMVYFAGGRRAR
jgi:SAM-dependent methyltransferase